MNVCSDLILNEDKTGKNSNLDHFLIGLFEDETKMKVPSEICSPL